MLSYIMELAALAYRFSCPRGSGFLFGESHVEAGPRDRRMLDLALSRADLAALETDAEAVLGKGRGAVEFSPANPFYTAHQERIDAIRAEYMPKVLAYLEDKKQGAGINQEFSHCNPYAIVFNLGSAALNGSASQPEPGPSCMEHIDRRCKEAGKPVRYLESVDEQLEFLWSPESVRFAYALFLFSTPKADYADMLGAKAGLETVVEKRDSRLADRIMQLPDAPLIVLGKAHLPGVMRRLGDAGYRFSPMVWQKAE